MTQTVLIGDICTKVTSGGTPSTKHDEYYGGDIPWLRTQEVNFGNIYSTEKTITEAGLKNSSAKLIPENSVIIAMYGATAGKSAINKIPLTTNQACCNLIVNHQKADYRYVYYYLSSNYENLLKSATGAAQQNLGAKQISAMSIELPDLETQKKIADILGTIDEKIELNRRMNETLEQMGQALFRHYFIDSPEAEKWEDGVVSDLITIYSGYAFKRTDFDPDGDYGLVTIKNVQDGNFVPECSDHLSSIPVKTPDYAFLNTGDILLSLTGNVGRVCIVHGENLLLNQRVAKLVGADDKQSFAYFMFRQEEFKNRLISMSRGTAQLNLSPIETKKIKLKLPPKELLAQYHEQAEPLFEAITANYTEIQTLTTLRDTLLPRLISGKVEV